MKLTTFKVTSYKSVFDSGEIKTDEITCLVGKNEAGKTSLLKALYALNPIRSEDDAFSVTDDYPRAEVADYEDEIERKLREHAEVIWARYLLQEPEVEEIEALFGPDFLREPFVSITSITAIREPIISMQAKRAQSHISPERFLMK